MTDKNNNSEATLYTSVSGMAAPLLGDECMFLAGAGGKPHPMTLDVLQAMDQCRSFQTIQGHVENIAAHLPALSEHRDAIAKVLQFLINRGLMVSADSMLQEIKAKASDQDMQAPVSCIIFADERPLALERLAISLCDYQARFGHDLRYTIIDQSRSREMLERNAAALSRLRETGAIVDHLDRDWQRRLIAHLAECCELPEASLGAALADSAGTGAAFNLALLLSAGSRCILIDDQFSFDARQRTGANAAMDIRPQSSEPLTLAVNSDTLNETLAPLDEDPLALALAFCGADLGTVVQQQGLAGSLAGLPGSMLEDLTHDCRVLTATLGSWGDSRFVDNQWLYRISPDALVAHIASREAYYDFLRRPALAQGFGQLQVSRVGRSAPGLIDNRSLLPPASVGSLDDRFAFQTWMHFIYPNSAALSIPALLRYRLQLTPQAQAAPMPPSAARFLGELALVRMDDCHAVDLEQRFNFLALLYQDLAAASGEHLQKTLRQFLVHTSSDRIRQIQQAMDATRQSPEYWRADAKDWLEYEVEQFSGNAAPALAGWDTDLDTAQCAEQLRQTVSTSALLLRDWPALWHACQGRFEELVKL